MPTTKKRRCRRDLHVLDARKDVLSLATLESDADTRLRAKIEKVTRHQEDPSMLEFVQALTPRHAR